MFHVFIYDVIIYMFILSMSLLIHSNWWRHY